MIWGPSKSSGSVKVESRYPGIVGGELPLMPANRHLPAGMHLVSWCLGVLVQGARWKPPIPGLL